MLSENISVPSSELLQILSVGWLEFLTDGKIIRANTFARQLLTFSASHDLQGVNFWELLFNTADRILLQQSLEKLQNLPPIETEMLCSAGDIIWVRLNVRVLRSTVPIVFGCTLENITAQKRLQKESQELNTAIYKQRRLADSLGRMMLSTSLLQDLPSLLRLICSEATDYLNMSSAQIWLLQDGSLAGEISLGMFQDEIKGLAIHPSEKQHIGFQALQKRTPLYLFDLHENGGMLHENFIDLFTIRSLLAVPLLISGRVIGVLFLFDQQQSRVLDGDDMEFSLQLGNQIAIMIANVRMIDDLKVANQKTAAAYDVTLAGWARALELRDLETEGHTQRVTKLTSELAMLFDIDAETMVQIKRGALLHDIGKMGIPDGILLKPGPLDELEQAVMRRHPEYAVDMLKSIDYLRPALDIPYCHHERWDGNGYPRGLRGKEIPLHARIFAIVDVWDALTSNRPYREAWTYERALEFIRSETGKHFDPDVVEKFLVIAPQWK